MSKWTRILVGLGIVVILCVLYMWFFGVQTIYVWETRRSASKNPIYWIRPVELLDLSISKGPSRKISYLGYEFEIPWNDVDEAKTSVHGTKIATVGFHSGNVITIWNKPVGDFVNMMVDDARIDRNDLAQLIGNNAIQSDYAFERAVLQFTPNDVSIFTSKKKAIQHGTLVMMKLFFLPTGSETGVYSIRTKEFMGFQYGRPLNPFGHLSVELYGTDAHVQIIFSQKTNGAVAISQADINRVVQTLHKVRTQDPKP
jgi:hypothetical protein